MLCALADYFQVTTDELLGRKKDWKYAVIAAETAALGEEIASIAKEYGIKAKKIFTDYDEAAALTYEDSSIRYIIAGFYSGLFGGNSAASALVSVYPSDREILDALRLVFEKYLDPDEHQFIVS